MESLILSYDFDIRNSRPIIEKFLAAMEDGLVGKPSTMPMIPCFTDVPTGNEEGVFLSIDFGGTNLRCMLLKIENRKIVDVKQKKVTIDKKTPTGELLFSTIAKFIESFVEENAAHIQLRPNRILPAGFSFSFPIHQTHISSGRLLYWGKGFVATGVQGQDVIQLLHAELDKRGLNWIRVVALCNDTVGTMASLGVEDPETCIGVILGTGTNACYREKVSNVTKIQALRQKEEEELARMGREEPYRPSPPESSDFMAINTEWGGFTGFPMTAEDDAIYAKTQKFGEQRFEKQTSGKYLPMIARKCVRKAIKNGWIFKDIMQKGYLKWDEAEELTPVEMSQVHFDETPDLSKAKDIILHFFGEAGKLIPKEMLKTEDVAMVRRLFAAIVTRSAKFIGVALAAVVVRILMHVNPNIARIRIAADGSVLRGYRDFLPHSQRALEIALEAYLSPRANLPKMEMDEDIPSLSSSSSSSSSSSAVTFAQHPIASYGPSESAFPSSSFPPSIQSPTTSSQLPSSSPFSSPLFVSMPQTSNSATPSSMSSSSIAQSSMVQLSSTAFAKEHQSSIHQPPFNPSLFGSLEPSSISSSDSSGLISSDNSLFSKQETSSSSSSSSSSPCSASSSFTTAGTVEPSFSPVLPTASLVSSVQSSSVHIPQVLITATTDGSGVGVGIIAAVQTMLAESQSY